MTADSKLREWRENPVTFVREVLGAEPDAWQARFLAEFPKRPRMALKACKGPGKSTVLSWLGWNFLLTRPHPKVICTSITGDNLRDGLWTEFAKWQQKSDVLRRAFKWSAERIVAVDHPETWFAAARTWAKGADPSQQANTLAGIHANYVLFLLDEAGGIPDAVVAAAEAGLANAGAEGTEAHLAISGNPTHLEGPLYRACTRERHLWFVQEISSDPDDPNRTPRVSAQWAREQIEKYGRDSPYVLVNVFGQFPPAQSNTLIGLELAAAASRRVVPERDIQGFAKVIGVDVARFGDDETVFCPRQGRVVYPFKTFRNLDTMDVADQVAWSMDRWDADAVLIDQTGVGAGVVDRLRQMGRAARVIGVDGASSPIAQQPKFLNRRAEMYWNTAQWLKEGSLPDDGVLVSQLAAPTYSFNEQGRLVVEPKKDVKKRLGTSPDRADALTLTFAVPVVPRAGRAPVPGKSSRLRGTLAEYEPYGLE